MGPLNGLRILELSGIGPGPMSGMLLADLGATVLRIERPVDAGTGIQRPVRFYLPHRGKKSVVVDLKSRQGVDFVLDLIERADGLIDPFRPGTLEKLGLAPEACFSRNARLVVGRISGWGQDGPLALAAGHDLNYIALSGVLASIGREGAPPTPPLNLIGDYAGAAYLVMGMLAALLAARTTGKGQVVDAAMVDAAASLMTPIYGLYAAGLHSETRGTNVLDSGSPIYDVYECADGRFVSIAPIERKFRAELFRRIGVSQSGIDAADDRNAWAALRTELATLFLSRTRSQWCELLEGTDSCFAPVLSLGEAPRHRHFVERRAFMDIDGVTQPAPAPRFSVDRCEDPAPPEEPGADPTAALAAWGFTCDDVDAWRADGALLDRIGIGSEDPT